MASMEKLIQIRLRMIDEVSKPLKGIANDLQKMSSSLTQAGTVMTAAFTVPLVAAGVAGVQLAKEFDTSMHQIASITDLTETQLNELGDSFIQLSMDATKTVDSANNLAQGYQQIVSSGIAAADAMDVLEVSTKAATAGLTTTEVAAESIVGTLNAYGLSAEKAAHISDIMFTTFKEGVGTFEELAGSLSNVTGVAAALGVPFEEVSAAMATMTKQGFDYSVASNAVRQAMTSMIKPTADGAKIIREMGYESGQAMLDALGFAGAMEAVAIHTGGSAEEMVKLFSDVDGLKAALALTGKGAQMFAHDLEAMRNSGGATAAAFEEIAKSFEFVEANFRNTWNNLLMDIGKTLQPILQGIMEFLIPIMKGFMELPEPIKQVIVVLGILLATVGPLLLIFGQLAGAFVAIQTAMATFGVAAGVFSMAFLPVIALIGAVIVAIGLLIANWEQLGTTISQLATIIDQKMGGMFSSIRDETIKLVSALANAWGEILSKAGTALGQLGQLLWKWIGDLGKAGWAIGDAITGGLLSSLANGFKELAKWLLSQVINLISQVRSAFGIHSPSKVMQDIGQNIVAGLHKGIENFGGIGVNVPQAGGSIQSRQPSLAYGGAGAGGGGVTQNFNIYPPIGTGKEQVDYIYKQISRKMADDAARRGARRTK